MIFEQSIQQAPSTKQLIIANTHIDPADEYRRVFYDDGIPKQLILSSINHPNLSLTIDLDTIMVIGRKRSMSDYQVNIDLTPFDAAELGVSSYHAMLLALDNHIYIKDLESLNGMLLNGKRITPSKEYIIDDGDIVAFGNLEIKIGFNYDS